MKIVDRKDWHIADIFQDIRKKHKNSRDHFKIKVAHKFIFCNLYKMYNQVRIIKFKKIKKM